jgi:acyl-CoA dehydrogenase
LDEFCRNGRLSNSFRVHPKMDFTISPTVQDYLQRLGDFMQEHVLPAEAEYRGQVQNVADWRTWTQPPIMEQLKTRAKAAGLWNLFLPEKQYGAGLKNAEYAPLAEMMGRCFIAPEVFNCSAPDTGNMEVLVKYGSEEQKDRWLKPLLAGEIRSAFCMTEPGVASSDATNMQATAIVDGNDVVLNGCKWWSSGAGHPHCRLLIFMGLTDPKAERYRQHSMVLVPLDTPGVKIVRMVPVFGGYDAPFGHGEVSFTNVRLPLDNIIAGLGRGFEIAQGRLGPGRIHHCMRTLGAAERALELLCQRSLRRVAFGKRLAELGGNIDVIANARIMIEQARLLTLRAAWMIDQVGAKGAKSEISQIKVVVPNIALTIIDQAIQMHGGAGVSDDFPLAELFATIRTLRIADGPDEVHRALIAKQELKKYQPRMVAPSEAASS